MKQEATSHEREETSKHLTLADKHEHPRRETEGGSDAYHLISQHQDCLQRELPPTIYKEIFETWSQQIKDKRILLPVYTRPFSSRNTT